MVPLLHLAAALAVYPAAIHECDRLVRDLASRDFATREAATKHLARLPLALPDLRRAALSPVPEQATRANRILWAMESDPASPVRRRLEEWIRLGRADLVAEYARGRRTEARRGADAVHRVGSQCYRLAQWDHPEVDLFRFRLKSTGLDTVPQGDRAVQLTDAGQLPPDVRRNPLGCYRGGALTTDLPLLTAAVAGTLDATPASCGTLIATGRTTLSGTGGVYGTVAVSGGDLRWKALPGDTSDGLTVSGAVIACDGDTLALDGPVSLINSVVFVRGNVVLDPHASLARTTILAGGTIRWAGKTPGPAPDCLLKEKTADPLATLRFFTLAEVGLHVEGEERAMRVTKVGGGSPVSWAGLKAGDVILTVDGQAATDAAELRRLVRTGYVLGDCTLVVRRGEETKELVVRFPE